jgi:biopolymer transport protein ExbB
MTISRWLAAILFTALVLPGAANASTWWQNDWPYRKPVTIDTTPKGVPISDPIGRAPLLLRLHSGNFNFSDASDNGSDLRFVASDDKTPLTYHIETYDPVLGVATVWVDVKDFPVGATKTFYMYYGNKKAAPALDTPGTFDPDYTLVYHFDAAAGAPPKDSTAYGNNAQTAPSSVDDGSVVGKGARFAGTGPVTVPASPSLALPAGGAFTFSAWVKADAPQPRAALFVRQDGASALVIGLDQGAPFVEAGGQRVIATTPLAKDAWGHIAVTADGHNLTLYVNGKQAGVAPATLPAFNGPIALGADLPGGATGAAAFIGGMDEVRLSKVARSPGLIAMDAASQGADSRLVTIPEAGEKRAGVGFGLFGQIVKSVDATAWWVIGILGIMSAASWFVMVTKVRYANASDRANDKFLKAFRELDDEVTALADEETVGPARTRQLGRSPIFRIYRAAAQEIRQREARGQVMLRTQAIEVIRSLMDANLVRENQKLSQNMVWLTISISGGPFIGLLGTVIGVMLVFAGVAAAGDVNINAIAPGISAALLATVAGLSVAIPAMFGYNYIIIRNKNIIANMNVFVDEFITRLCEFHAVDE